MLFPPLEFEGAQAQTAANATRGAGGSSATLMDTLLRLQGGSNKAVWSASAQGEGIANSLMQQEGAIVDDMAQRRLMLQNYNRDRAMAKWAMAQQGSERNLMASVGMLPQLGFSGVLGGNKNAGVVGQPSQAQIGSPDTYSGYTDPGLGAEVTALANAGQASHWQ